jgi:hypothetical protein
VTFENHNKGQITNRNGDNLEVNVIILLALLFFI